MNHDPVIEHKVFVNYLQGGDVIRDEVGPPVVSVLEQYVLEPSDLLKPEVTLGEVALSKRSMMSIIGKKPYLRY